MNTSQVAYCMPVPPSMDVYSLDIERIK